MASSLAAPPLLTPLTDDPKDGLITKVWGEWLRSLTTRIQTSSTTVATVALTAQSASIGATPFNLGTVRAGVYRVSWALHVTTAAGVSSSAMVTISYTDSAISCTQAGAALTTNTNASVQTGMLLVRSDASAPISYAVTYASNAANAMQFKIDLIAELVS